MAKSITILEGQTSKSFTAKKLKTNVQGGGTCTWVPEDEVQLMTKHITEDGTYIAAEEEDEHGVNLGKYGYSKVTVNGIGKATGRDPEDGNDYSIGTDESGDLTKTVLPSSIAIITPPTKTAYQEGETIDYTGMVVKAYLNDGTLWTDTTHPDGIIPLSELDLPVTVADIDESAFGGTGSGGRF